MNNRKKTFWIIFTGETFSMITSAIVQFVLIRYLTDKTWSATVLAIATVVGFLPQIIFGPFIGVFIDRRDRKKILIYSDIGIALATFILAIVFHFFEPHLYLIYIALAIRSFGNAFYQPAMQASIPLLVPENKIVTIGGISQSIMSFSVIIGTVIGGMLYAIRNVEQILYLDVIGAIIWVIALCLVKIPNPPEKEKLETPNIIREMKEGFFEVKNNKKVAILTIFIGFFALIYMPIGSLFPLMTKNYFALGSLEASYVEMAFGIGMFIWGILLSIRWGFKKKQKTIFISCLLIGIVLVGGGIVPVHLFILYIIACGIMGFMGPFFNTPYMAILQTNIAPEKLWRVMSLITTMFLLVSPLGLLIATPVTNILGIEKWFVISGIAMLIICIIAFFNKTLKKAAF